MPGSLHVSGLYDQRRVVVPFSSPLDGYIGETSMGVLMAGLILIRRRMQGDLRRRPQGCHRVDRQDIVASEHPRL